MLLAFPKKHQSIYLHKGFQNKKQKTRMKRDYIKLRLTPRNPDRCFPNPFFLLYCIIGLRTRVQVRRGHSLFVCVCLSHSLPLRPGRPSYYISPMLVISLFLSLHIYLESTKKCGERGYDAKERELVSQNNNCFVVFFCFVLFFFCVSEPGTQRALL